MSQFRESMEECTDINYYHGEDISMCVPLRYLNVCPNLTIGSGRLRRCDEELQDVDENKSIIRL